MSGIRESNPFLLLGKQILSQSTNPACNILYNKINFKNAIVITYFLTDEKDANEFDFQQCKCPKKQKNYQLNNTNLEFHLIEE